MAYNNRLSRISETELRSLGVFRQLDDSFAFSETSVEQFNIDDLSLFEANSLLEGIKTLKQSLDDMIMDYCSTWKQLEDFIDSIQKNTFNNTISSKLINSLLNNLIHLSSDYKDLDEVNEKLKKIRSIRNYISDKDVYRLSYYSTIIFMVDDELRTENERILRLEELLEGDSSSIKTAGLFGQDDGMGGRGRSTMWSTPYGGFDYANDRVMDGREIGEGKGWATEKFKTTNKFKRHPELNPYKKYFKYRLNPTMKNPNRKRLKNRRKNKDRKGGKKVELLGNGKVYVSTTNDPAYTYWVDQQRNKAYSWGERNENSVYPTWDAYKK
jgi:hypothetical protein